MADHYSRKKEKKVEEKFAIFYFMIWNVWKRKQVKKWFLKKYVYECVHMKKCRKEDERLQTFL